MLDPFDDDFYTDTVSVVPLDAGLDDAGAPGWVDADSGAAFSAAVRSISRAQGTQFQPGDLGGVDLASIDAYLVHFKSSPGDVQPGQRIVWTHHREGVALDPEIVLTAIGAAVPPQFRPRWTVPCRRAT